MDKKHIDDNYSLHHNVALPIALAEELAYQEWLTYSQEKEMFQAGYEAQIAARRALEDAPPDESASGPMANYSGARLRIFEMDEVDFQAANHAAAGGDRNQQLRTKALVKLLKERGPWRRLATLPMNWRGDLDCLQTSFPNFGEVIDYVRITCALAEQTDRAPRLCLLLSGPPGTGKSMFAQALAEWINGGFACVRFESAQSNSEMAGSSSFWSNTQAGKPFTLLVERDYANPTFFLDEIDKVNVTTYDPLGALYSLLEPDTAKTHTDLSWPFLHLDCSRINYIAACNEPNRIPAPLLSRFRQFDIAAPTPCEARVIADHIVADALTLANQAQMQFADEAIDALCQMAPRRMRQMAQEAVGRALFHQRNVVDAGDIANESVQERRFGFVH